MITARDRLYLYAIVDGNVNLDHAPCGLDGNPVTLLRHDALAAVVGDIELGVLNDTVQAALVHEEVVEEILAHQRALPVRFGTVFSSRRALIDALDAHGPRLLEDLVRLDGQVELGLRVLWDADEQVALAGDTMAAPKLGNADTPGVAYLRTKFAELEQDRALRRSADAIASLCRQTLEAYCTTIQTDILLTSAMPVSAACLMPRKAVDAAVAAISQLQASRTDLRYICTGPWPPYHFIANPKGEST